MKELDRLLQLAGKKKLNEARFVNYRTGEERDTPFMSDPDATGDEEYDRYAAEPGDEWEECDACFGDREVDGKKCKKCNGTGVLEESYIFPKLNKFTKSYNNRHLVEARVREFVPGDRVYINSSDHMDFHGVVDSVHFPVADLEIGATVDPNNTKYEVKVDGGRTKMFGYDQLSRAFLPTSTFRHTVSREGIHSFIEFPNDQPEGRTAASWLNKEEAEKLIKKYKLDTKWKGNVKRTK